MTPAQINKNSIAGNDKVFTGVRLSSSANKSNLQIAEDIEKEAVSLLKKVCENTIPSGIKHQKHLTYLIAENISKNRNTKVVHHKDSLIGLTMLISGIKSDSSKLKSEFEKIYGIMDKSMRYNYLNSVINPLIEVLKKDIDKLEVLMNNF